MTKPFLPTLLSFLFLTLTGLQAQETKGVENQLIGGLALNDGNTDNQELSLGWETNSIQAQQEWRLTANYEYGRTRESTEGEAPREFTHIDKSDAALQFNQLVTEAVYGFLKGSAERDMRADLRARFLVGPGLGLFLLRNDIMTLAGETGVVYWLEDRTVDDEDFLALRLAQRFEWKLEEGSRLWQNLEWVGEIADSENYLFNAELGAEAKIHSRLSLRLSLRNQYNSRPAAGKDTNDLRLVSGFALKF